MVRYPRMAFAIALTVLVGMPLVPRAQSPATVRVSVSSTGAQGNAPSVTGGLSRDGRYVVFESSADTLVTGDTNAASDIFVHDRLSRRTERVSLSTNGGQSVPPFSGASPSGSTRATISDDGRFVAFHSRDAGLVENDTTLSEDVFVRDRDVDEDGIFDEPAQVRTSRASIRSDGSPGTCVHPIPPCNVVGGDTELLGLSGNGRHVFFLSKWEFDDLDTNGQVDLFAHDLRSRRTTRLPASLPTPPGGISPSVPSDRSGRYLVVAGNSPPAGFESVSILDRDVNGNDVFDEAADLTLARVPTPPGAAAGVASPRAISSDSTLVAFARQVGSNSELWIWHRIGNVARRVASTATFGGFFEVQFSDDRRQVVYSFVEGDPSVGIPVSGTRIATFDADGDGHLDPEASIGSIAVPPLGGNISHVEFDGTLRYFLLLSVDSENLVPGDNNGWTDVFVHDRQSPALDTFDTDGDGLANTFEQRFGLNAASGAGTEGATGDPDGDGQTNAQEQAAGTHPRGYQTRYLAEGATGSFFSTRISVANAGAAAATVLLRYQTDTGHTTSTLLQVPVQRRRFVNVGQVPSLGNAAFSTVIESDVPIIVDRSMFWGDGLYGSSAETSVASPATTWYLAEGATHGFFDLFYLLQNPSATTAAQVEARFLLPSGAPIVRTYTVPPATRMNILVDTIPGLDATDVSGVVASTNGVPIIVERAMYFSRDGQPFRAGHASAGVTAPATTWRLAEGATGTFFDLFVLVANPSATPAEVRTTYLRPAGPPIVRSRTIAPNSRLTIYVEHEDPALADTAVSTVVESTNGVPIVVERAMWWPSPGGAWQEAHNSFGATQTARAWGFADGEVGTPPVNTQTYFLIANDTPDTATVAVTLLFDSLPAVTRHYTVPGNSRFNVPVDHDFPEAAGRGFGAEVVSMGTPGVPIVVERAMYSDANGVIWAAGTNVLGTPLPYE